MTTRALPRTGDAGLDRLLAALVPALDPEEIWLFGSRARGEADEDSDYDLLVVMADDAPAELLSPVVAYRAARPAGVAVDVIPARHARFNRYRNTVGTLAYEVAADGRRIYVRAD